MSKQDIVFIINPKAGGSNGTILTKIEKLVYSSNLKCILLTTQHKGHAVEYAQEYLGKGYIHFVAVGGDGTVNEVSKTLIKSEAILSIIPIGSGNGLARSLNIPINVEAAFNLIINKKTLRIDSGNINGHSFLCTAGIGFDALCAEKFDKGVHKRGIWNYIKIIFQTYFFFKPLKITLNNQASEMFSLTFANANQFGNNAYIAPDALIDDGFLDCSIINPHPKIFGFYLGYLLMSKKIRGSKYSEYFRSKSFEVSSETNFLIHIDGESLQLDTNIIKVECIERCLTVTI